MTSAPALGRLPGVSVVIPTYNRRRRVERAVRSVLAQTFADFELLVIDDGSEDGTGERLAGIDPRLRYHRQENRGPSAARNAGIQLARNPVIAFLDADIEWQPDHLEVVAALLARYPEAVLASTCPEFMIGGEERPEDGVLIDALPVALLSNWFGYTSCIAARRQPLLDIEGFDEQLEVGEDDDLWLRLAMKGPFALVRRGTVIRRHTRGGLRDHGRSSGIYTEANIRSLKRAIGQLERRPGNAREELLDRARARLHLLYAVAALQRHDTHAARKELAIACRLLPELETTSGPILAQLWKSATDRAELGWRVEAAAAVMPDPRSHAAMYFRGWAAVVALSRGRLWKAAQLVLRRPHILRRDFIAGSYRPGFEAARRRVVEVVQSRRESPLPR
jgi:glycosyltransferase involved in cell wall biosynthesis